MPSRRSGPLRHRKHRTIGDASAEHELCRELGGVPHPAHADHPILERLAERAEHGHREVPHLVQEKHPVRGETWQMSPEGPTGHLAHTLVFSASGPGALDRRPSPTRLATRRPLPPTCPRLLEALGPKGASDISVGQARLG